MEEGNNRDEPNRPNRARPVIGAAALVNPSTQPVAGWSNITPGRGRGRGATRERAVVARMGTLEGPRAAEDAFTTISQKYVMESDLQPALLEERKSKDGFHYIKHAYGGVAEIESKKREFSETERTKVTKGSMHSLYYDFEEELPEEVKKGARHTQQEDEDLKKAFNTKLLGKLQQLSSLGYAKDTSKLPPVTETTSTVSSEFPPSYPPTSIPVPGSMPPPAHRPSPATTATTRVMLTEGVTAMTAQQRRLLNVFARTDYASFTKLKNQQLLDFYSATRNKCMHSVTNHQLARHLPSHPYMMQTEPVLLSYVHAWGDDIEPADTTPEFTLKDLTFILKTGCGLSPMPKAAQHYPSYNNETDSLEEARKYIRVLYTYSMNESRDWLRKEDPDRLADVINDEFVNSWIEDFLVVVLVLHCRDVAEGSTAIPVDNRTYRVYSFFYYIHC